MFLSGLIQISFGIVKIGKWIKYIPYPVISGFMSGIGIIIIILQINSFVGVDSYGSVIETVVNIPNTIKNIDFHSFIIASITLAIMFLTPKKIARLIPPALIALVFVTLLSVSMNFSISTIGEIPMGYQSLYFLLVLIS
ncbi:MAG: SulP family inorganic anion transporter [Halarcobacter ebronensis]